MTQTNTLYKYRDWKNDFHKKILTENELYIPKVSEVNDPYDFKLYLDFDLLKTPEEQAEYIEIYMRDSEEACIDRGIDRNKVKAKLRSLFSNNITRRNFEREYNRFSNNYMNERIGIYCLSSRWNSILMWTHYSSCHTGFCIGLNKNKLESSLIFGSGGPVVYTDEFPKINPLKNESREAILLQSHTKAKDWHYEEEYRYVRILDNKSTSEDASKIHFSDGLIAEIILGLRVDKNSKAEISEIAKEKKIPLYQILSSEKEFKLEKTLT